MNNFTFYSPTYFAFSKDAENQAGALVKRFGGTNALIHYGGGSVVRSGLLERVQKSLDDAGIRHVELGGVKPNPRSGLVYEGIDLARREGVDFVLAVGSGSTIDSSKAIAAGAIYDGDFWDFYAGKRIEEALPVGTVLTIAAAGSEALRRFLKSIGMPETLGELGGKEEDIPKLVDALCNGDGRPGHITGFVTLNQEDCANIYRMML